MRGPSTKEELKLWELIKGRKAEFEAELRELEALRDDPEYPHKKFVLDDIGHTKKVLAIINSAYNRWNVG